MDKFVFVFVLLATFNFSAFCHQKVLTRKRRYLKFPEGSSLSVAACMTSQMGITPGQLFTESVNWSINYNLPQNSSDFKPYRRPMAELRRRSRRDLYGKIETLLTSAGYNGRSCVLKTLCEASQRLKPKGETLIHEILNIVFRFPLQKLQSSEPEEHRIYHLASRSARNGNADEIGNDDVDCSTKFSDCPFSLIDMALGYYSTPEEGFV